MHTPTGPLLPALLLGTLLALGQGGLASAASPAAQQRPAAEQTPPPTATLTVEPSILSFTVKPGGTDTAELTVRAGVPLDVEMIPEGLGQGTDGSFTSLPPDRDTSPYSARAMMAVAPQDLRMEPGASRKVTVTVTVPEDAGQGTRYAVLRISGLPAGADQNVGIGVGLGVTTLVTVADTAQTRTGDISDLSLGEWLPGRPLPVTAVLRNTGDTHFGAPPYAVTATATLQNGNGDLVAMAETTLTGNSIVPTFVREVKLLLDPGKPLPDGRYHLEVGAGLADGTVLDRQALDFEQPSGAVAGVIDEPPPVVEPAPAPAETDDGLLLLVCGLMGVVAAAIVLSASLLGRRRHDSRTTNQIPGR